MEFKSFEAFNEASSKYNNIDLSEEERQEVIENIDKIKKLIVKGFPDKKSIFPKSEIDVPALDDFDEDGKQTFEYEGELTMKYNKMLIPLVVFANGTAEADWDTDDGDYMTPASSDLNSATAEYDDFTVNLDGGWDDELLSLDDVSKDKKFMSTIESMITDKI